MTAVRTSTSGFTLVELMFSLAIALILMMLCVPFGVAWMDGARQLQAKGELIDAVGRAKSIALRNGNGRASGEVVSRVVVDGDVLSVRNEHDGATLWSAPLPRDVSVATEDDQPFVCAAFDSRAMSIVDSAGACTLSQHLVVRVASRDEINVELL